MDAFAKQFGVADENFIKFLKDTEYSEKTLANYETYMKKTAKATSAFGATLKSVGANLGIMLAITLAVQALSAAWDYLNVTMEEQQEIVDGLKTDIEGLKIEYDELNDKGNLTAQEKEKLKMLERQLEVKQEMLKLEEKELAEKELHGTGTLTSTGKLASVNSLTAQRYSDDVDYQIKQLDKYREALSEVEDFDSWNAVGLVRMEKKTVQEIEDQRIAIMEQWQAYKESYDLIKKNLDAGIWDDDPERKKYHEDLLDMYKRGMEDLQAVTDKIDLKIGISFDIESAKSYLTKELKDAGKYDEKWLDDLSDEDIELLYRIENIGKYSLDELDKMIADARQEAEEPIEIEVTTADIITELDDMSEGFEKISEIYNDIKDMGDFDFSNLSKNSDFGAIFGGDETKAEFEEFVDIVAKSPNDIKACQSAFDNLVSSWLYAQSPFEKINEENKEAYVQWLKSKGVLNANEVATYALAKSKIKAFQETNKLTQGTDEEIQKLWDEASAAGFTEGEFIALINAMIQANESNLDFTQQINALNQLAIKAGETAGILGSVNATKLTSDPQIIRAAADRGMDVEDYVVATYGNTIVNSASFTPKPPTVKYSGTTGSGSGGSSSSKDPHVAEVDKYKELENAVSEYDRKLEKLERTYDNTDSIEERIGLKQAEIKLYQEQKDAIDALNKARDKEISANVDKLRSVGFKIDYDPNTENLIIHNREHINSLSQDIIKTYEDLLETTDELNDANKDSADQWDELTHSIVKAGKELNDLEREKYEDYIEGAEHILRMMENRADAFGKESSAYTDMMEKTLLRWKDLVTTDYEGNIDEIRELEEEWMDFYDARIEREKEILEMQLDNNDKVLDGVIKVIDDEIKAIDDQIDSLSKANDERKKALELQKAQAELDKARNQKTRMVLRKGVGWVYEADEDAIKEAEENLSDIEYDSKVDKLEEEKEALEDLKEKWEEIPDVYENEQNKLLMIEKLGADAEEDILSGRLDIFDNFKDDYIDIQEQIQDKTDELEEHTSQAYMNVMNAFENMAKIAGIGLNKTATQKTQSSWYVNKDGKAPSQAQVGDLVYTKGGTYKITSKDENGKFSSEKIDNVSTAIPEGMWGKKFKETVVGITGNVTDSVDDIINSNKELIDSTKKQILTDANLQKYISDNTRYTADEVAALLENADVSDMLSDYTDENSDATDDNTRALYDFIDALANLELEIPLEEMTLENFDDSIMSESDQAYIKELQRAWNLAMEQGNTELADMIHAMADEARLRYLDDDPNNDYNKIAEEFAKLADSKYEHTSSSKIGGSDGDSDATQKYLNNLHWLKDKISDENYQKRLDAVEDIILNGSGLTSNTYTDQYGRTYTQIDANNVNELNEKLKELGYVQPTNPSTSTDKTSSSSSGNKTSGQKTQDKYGMSDSDKAAIQDAQNRYNSATTQAEKDKAHADAEAIRNKYGYSGGTDGSKDITISNAKVAKSLDNSADASTYSGDGSNYSGDASYDLGDTVSSAADKIADATDNLSVDVNVNVSGGGSYGGSSLSGSSSDDGKYHAGDEKTGKKYSSLVEASKAQKAINDAKKKKARGGRNLVEDIYNVDEKGRELLVQPTQGRYVHLSAGSGVIPADITDVLWKFGQNPSGFVKDLGIDYNKSIKPVAMSSNNAVNYNISKVEMHGVDDWMGFMNELQHLPMDANQHSYIR